MVTVLIQVMPCSSADSTIAAGRQDADATTPSPSNSPSLFTAGPACAICICGRRTFSCGRAERHRNVFMDRLPLVVVFGVRLTIWPRDRLRSFIGLEPQIALLVLSGAPFVSKAAVAEHQVVMRL